MENAIGWLLAVLLIAAPVFIIYAGVKLYKKQKQKAAEEQQRHEEALANIKKEREASYARAYSGATHVGKTTYDYNLNTSRTTVTEKDTGRRVSYVHENDNGPDLLTTMIVADMLFNHKESSSGSVTWNNDIPSVSTSDDDTRKSSSSSYDSGPSYSDSGPSSSDSGPSSDW